MRADEIRIKHRKVPGKSRAPQTERLERNGARISVYTVCELLTDKDDHDLHWPIDFVYLHT